MRRITKNAFKMYFQGFHSVNSKKYQHILLTKPEKAKYNLGVCQRFFIRYTRNENFKHGEIC